MTAAATFALSSLRLRLNRATLPFQVAIDLLLPVGYALLVARTTPAGEYPRLVTAAFMVAAMLSLMRIAALMLMIDRVFGTRDLLMAAGVTRRDYLFANGAGAAYFSVFPLAALCLTAWALHVPLSANGLYWLILVLYALTLHGLSLVLASLFENFGPFNLAINILLLGTAAFCPIYYPADRVPGLLRPLVDLLPGTITADLADAAVQFGPLDPIQFGGLCVWALAALGIGYRMLPWAKRR